MARWQPASPKTFFAEYPSDQGVGSYCLKLRMQQTRLSSEVKNQVF